MYIRLGLGDKTCLVTRYITEIEEEQCCQAHEL